MPIETRVSQSSLSLTSRRRPPNAYSATKEKATRTAEAGSRRLDASSLRTRPCRPPSRDSQATQCGLGCGIRTKTPGSRSNDRAMRFGVWDPHENPGRRSNDRASGFWVWDPHENPGHRPKTVPSRVFATPTVFRFTPTTSEAQKKYPSCRACVSRTQGRRQVSVYIIVLSKTLNCSHVLASRLGTTFDEGEGSLQCRRRKEPSGDARR